MKTSILFKRERNKKNPLRKNGSKYAASVTTGK